jgi:heat-inducible transcriptional repressor
MTHHLNPKTASLSEMDARARDIFRRIVEEYLETGAPVGSRTISKVGVDLSPASIRNTMADLTSLGLLEAAHATAGRLPSHAGLRLFVDGFLEIGDLSEDERREIEARVIGQGRGLEDALDAASHLLSGLAGGAGVVSTPTHESGVNHVEFVPLSDDRTLVIVVLDDGTVENRVMLTPPGFTPDALERAARFLNSRLRGRTLIEAKDALQDELTRARAELDTAAAALVEGGLAAWAGSDGRERAMIVRGRANLLEDAAALADLERVRSLFDDLENKTTLLQLLDLARDAEGVRIFIGAETRLFSLSGSAVVAAPYTDGRGRVVGALGVIGPARLNYARVIPMVDYTAKLIGRILE